MEKIRKPWETIAAETVRFNQNEASCRTKPPHCRCCWVTLLLPLIPLAAADPCFLLLLHPSRPAPSLLAAAVAAICCCLLLLSTTHPRSLWILTSAEAVCSTRLKKTPVDSELLTRWAPSGRRIQQKDSKIQKALEISTFLHLAVGYVGCLLALLRSVMIQLDVYWSLCLMSHSKRNECWMNAIKNPGSMCASDLGRSYYTIVQADRSATTSITNYVLRLHRCPKSLIWDNLTIYRDRPRWTQWLVLRVNYGMNLWICSFIIHSDCSKIANQYTHFSTVNGYVL